MAERRIASTRKAREIWSRALRPSRFSVRTHLVALIFVVVAPLVAFNGFLVLRAGTHDATLFGAGGVSLALALLVAVVIGHRITRAATGLVDYAEVVGHLEHIGPPATGILETESVAQSLYLVVEQLRQNAHEHALLMDRTITAQQAERKRIVRELHDRLSQHLAALGLGLRAIEPHFGRDHPAHLRLAELRAITSVMGRELHRTASELWPMALDDLGLQQAVTQYLEEWVERSGLTMDLEISLDARRLPQPVETALFRALQEALSNAVKRSGADRVSVILEGGDRHVQLIVEDNGRGFGVDWREFVEGQHLGLLGLRERLALAGGSLEVESSEQGGTTVYVRLPL